jgi:hypothetical protein
MLRAIQPRAVRLYRIEEQDVLRTILVGVRYYRNPITRLERVPIPPLAEHEADARSLDIPGSNRRPVGRGCSNDDNDVAVRVLPPILPYDTSIRNILTHIEHRARMMRESRTSGHQHEAGRGRQNRNCSIHLYLYTFSKAGPLAAEVAAKAVGYR